MTDDAPVHRAAFVDHGKDVFVGRAAEEEWLRRAFKRSLEDTVTVLVEGVSGIGRPRSSSISCRRPMEQLRQGLVLRSRCHLQEAVQYNAVDGLIDNLSRFLVLQTPTYLADTAPKHLNALLKVFPVLARVPFPKRLNLPALATDPHVVLRQAWEALRGLLMRVTEKRPLIVWIDDAQWCDVASASLLRDVFMHPDAPKNLLILSFRSEDRSNSDVISLLSGSDPNGMPDPQEHLTLSPLDENEIRSLISNIGRIPLDTSDDLLRQISRDTGGLPFFVVELAHHYTRTNPQGLEQREQPISGPCSRTASASLPTALRFLLEIVAVSSGPLEEDAVMEVAEASGAGAAAVYRLCSEHLLRKTMVRGQWSLESYHDRISTNRSQSHRLQCSAKTPPPHRRGAQNATPQSIPSNFSSSTILAPEIELRRRNTPSLGGEARPNDLPLTGRLSCFVWRSNCAKPRLRIGPSWSSRLRRWPTPGARSSRSGPISMQLRTRNECTAS